MGEVKGSSKIGDRILGGRALWIAAGTLLLVSPGFCDKMAELEPPLEYQVKAAFLLNFSRFVDWPADGVSAADAPFSICILGEDPFGPALQKIVEGETINGRKAEVRRVGPAQAASCQILYASRSEKELSRVLSRLGPGVLTVGEGDRFLKEGGMIAFLLENRRVRFDINQSAAARAGLKISSKLLAVARNVEK